MNEIQQLLSTLTDLEEEMKHFSGLVKEVMSSITMQEFVPEKANTEMMQCIMELNTKQKECLKLYRQANLGDNPPKKIRIMRDQLEKRKGENRKIEYLESVKKSFLSLYTENAEVEAKLQEFKEKIVTIKVDKYPLEKCLVYIRPFAVFLTMIKADDPVKAIEQVPVLNEYFGSALVAHITISKDIFIGEDAREFNMEAEEASDLPKDSTVKGKNESVQNVESRRNQADTAKDNKQNVANTNKAPVQSKQESVPVAQPQPAAKAAPAQPAVQPKAEAKAEEVKAAPAQPAVQPQAEAKAEGVKAAPAQPAAQPQAEAKAEEVKAAPAQPATQPQAEAKAEEVKAAPAQPAAQPQAEAKTEEVKAAPAQPATQPQAEAKAEEVKAAPAQPATQPQAEAKTEEAKSPAKKPEAKAKESVPEKDAPVAKPKKVPPDNKKRTKPKRPKKVDLKALLEEDGFREDKLDDPELRQMQEQDKKGKKGKKDSNFSLLKGPGSF